MKRVPPPRNRQVERVMHMRWLSPLLFSLLLGSLLQASQPLPASAQSDKGALWVFAVGVSQYQNPALSLQYADHDAEALAKALQEQSGKIFRQVHTKVLVNQQTNRQAILAEMQTFFASAAAEDAALIALMGHGVVEK
ncbi:MAG: caspase family protein, partial [Candidatus Binatia bacterium]